MDGTAATLHARIIEAIRRFVIGMLTRTWAEIDCWLDVMRATQDSHFEVD
jgi:hypothetical protein